MKLRNEKCEKEIAGGKKLECENEQGDAVIVECTHSLGRFADANELLNAYNSLQAEFTKRSQQLRRLERELSAKELEQTNAQSGEPAQTEASAEIIQDETGSVVKDLADERLDSNSPEYDEGYIAGEVAKFLSVNPEAVEYAEEIAQRSSESGYLGSGFLQNAYLSVLRDKLKAERDKITEQFILERAINSPSVKQKIIRDYLSEVTQNRGARLISGGGESIVMPPSRPKDISQAGEMAYKILKNK